MKRRSLLKLLLLAPAAAAVAKALPAPKVQRVSGITEIERTALTPSAPFIGNSSALPAAGRAGNYVASDANGIFKWTNGLPTATTEWHSWVIRS